MNRSTLAAILVSLTALASPLIARADDARVREAMKSLTVRLRNAETEMVNAQSAKAQLEQEKKTLTDKVDALSKQAAEDAQTITTLKETAAQHDAELAQFRDAIEKWKLSQGNAVALATKTEAERAKLAGQVSELQRKLADRETKNVTLFRTANEILTRYERFGLGDALAAREPFTGNMRVKLENQVQDYRDKIDDSLVKHGASAGERPASASR